LLMLECGVPWRKIKEAFNYQTSKLDGLLLSHEHLDHAKAAKDAAKSGIDIYLSKGTKEALNIDGHRLHTIESKKQFTVGSWKILPFDIVHDSTEPLGFLLASGQEKALFVVDSSYCPYRFKGLTLIALAVNYDTEILRNNITADHIHIEVGKRILKNHMSLQTAKGFFEANDMSRVREIHLLHLSDANSDAARFKSEIEELCGKPVYIGEG